MSHSDPYVYPGTTVLRNKYDWMDQDELHIIESISTGGNLLYLQKHPVDGSFDFDHLKKIHHFIFQDIYEWAGDIRTVDIGKNNLFCRVQFINDYAETVFDGLFDSCYAARKDRKAYISTLVSRYADLNALHPFREGNGRAQREFIRELCLRCGYVLDFTTTKHQEMLEASIASFNTKDYSRFHSIFERAVIPVDDYRDLQARLNSTLLTLSEDDL